MSLPYVPPSVTLFLAILQTKIKYHISPHPCAPPPPLLSVVGLYLIGRFPNFGRKFESPQNPAGEFPVLRPKNFCQNHDVVFKIIIKNVAKIRLSK